MKSAKLDGAEVRRALEGAVLEVLETMCFEFPVAEPAPGPAPDEDAVLASARFEGSLHGVLHVALAGEAPRRLAAAFLGLEEEDVREQAVLLMASELANMVCGAAMSRLEPRGRLRIAPPEAGRGGPLCHDGCWLHFPLEAGEVTATLICEEKP